MINLSVQVFKLIFQISWSQCGIRCYCDLRGNEKWLMGEVAHKNVISKYFSYKKGWRIKNPWKMEFIMFHNDVFQEKILNVIIFPVNYESSIHLKCTHATCHFIASLSASGIDVSENWRWPLLSINVWGIVQTISLISCHDKTSRAGQE